MKELHYMTITMRVEDRDKFGFESGLGLDWRAAETTCYSTGGLMCVITGNIAHMGWNNRDAAAKAGIPFSGYHTPGRKYAEFAFASIDGKLEEAEVDTDLKICLQLDRNMRCHTHLQEVRRFIEADRKVDKLFGIKSKPELPFGFLQDEIIGVFYLLRVVSDVEPQLLGPFACAHDRDKLARDLKKKRGSKDGLFKLNIDAADIPAAEAYAEDEL